VQLDDNNLCRLFGDPSRPAVCGNFKADADICGAGSQQAMANLIELEQLTQ
jgi:hypothetical protein